ncbi:MAG TPA: response regulator [Trueperaceae bacterium]|nr:response regulator [Trueperaceae bacterium]
MSDRHILIADPDPVQRQLIDMLLADDRTEIVAVDSARSVLEYLRSNTPALILMSHELADLSGISVSKRVKSVQRLSRVPIIVTTAEPSGFGIDPALRRSADEAGVDLLLPKPLGDKALKERSRRLLAAAEAGVTSQARQSSVRNATTAVIEQTLRELDVAGEAVEAVAAAGVEADVAVAQRAADGNGADVAEVMKELLALREENALVKRRLASQQQTIDTLKAELEEAKRNSRSRGLFGRRR